MVAPCWGFCLPEPIGPGPPEPPLFFLPYQEPSTTVGTASLLLESDHARREIKDELGAPNPNTGLYREYAAADVRLNPVRMPRDLGAADPVSPGDPVAMEGASHEGVEVPASGEVEGPVAAHGEPLTACLWCREPLPRRKTLNYCPFCGADLHTIPCPNCGEELEVAWRFCVACRTEVGGPD